MIKPIKKFKDMEQMKECAEYYVRLLGLQDWDIAYSIDDDFDKTLAGQNEVQYIGKCSFITLKKTVPKNDCFIQWQEEVLIHELLHCKFIGIESSNRSVENVFYESYQHTLLEDMAKAIFKARYNFIKC